MDQCAQQARSKFAQDSNSPQLSEWICRIKIFEESSANTKERIAEVKKYRAAFMKGIEKRSNDLNALDHYVVEDGKIYMAMNNKYNSKGTMITKKIDPVRHEASFQKNIEFCEAIMPRMTERMKTWDTDLAKAASEDKMIWRVKSEISEKQSLAGF